MLNNQFDQVIPDSQWQKISSTLSTSNVTHETDQSIASILIIDDSNRICSLIVTGIINSCIETGYSVSITQSSDLGLISTTPINFGIINPNPQLPKEKSDREGAENLNFMVYTANSPRHAIPVLNLPNLKRLTIISDIMMPADTEVGLIGMLDELARLQLPINLVFTSSESQNRDYVIALIKSGKAFFLEKGTATWADLPHALVHQSDRFSFKTIAVQDYDNGTLRRRQPKVEVPPEPIPVPSLVRRTLNTIKNFWKRIY